jgi:simple sugar transport system permease protein
VATDAATLAGGQAIGVTVLVVLAGLLVGMVAGLVNGVLVSVLGVTPILATLGTMQLFNGLAIVWTGGKSIYGLPDAFLQFGIGTVAWIPITFLLFAVVAAALGILVRRTGLGTKLLLVGANPTAARYAGIDSRRVLVSTYVLSGLLAAVAGVIITSRSASASPDYGASYLLLAIVIAVLGGTNPMGGFGTVAGVVLATLTLQMVSSGFNIVRLSAFQYTIAQGLILIFVMVLDVRHGRRRRRRASAAARPPADEGVPVAHTTTDAAGPPR